MCGIVGLIAKTDEGRKWMSYIKEAASCLQSRGPDAENFFSDDFISLGHRRLTIIDLSAEANQPMSDVSGRYYIIYNGEIFNYRELRKQLESRGLTFHTSSDTEVLLQLYIQFGKQMLDQLNGFFAFAIYDRHEQSCFIARDRFGVKPLVYYEDENSLIFASEIKALLTFPIERKSDAASLYQYLQLNYITAPHTIFTRIKKLLPGHFLYFQNKCSVIQSYYSIPFTDEKKYLSTDYESKQKELFELLDDAVRIRLISDVPLGSFLSGGIDSSIICGLASKHTSHLKTFSIGYKDDAFFDETNYARLVASHFNTDHTVFTLSREDLYESIFEILDYFGEPFGDSSALPVFLLSRLTRKHVKVSLSGDGADELFGGYNKHIGEYRARNAGLAELFVASLNPLLKVVPKSRDSSLTNRLRQMMRFSDGMKLDAQNRYWRWCSIQDERQWAELISGLDQETYQEFERRKGELTKFIHSEGDLNEVLRSDVNLDLPDDMLMKVDSMSMANSLEVRTPFLDYRVVEFAFSIPASYKINRHRRKIILHDAFKKFLPKELYHRPKRGFEIPLHSFLTNELRSTVEKLFSAEFIRDQNIFNVDAVNKLKQQLYSSDPDDSAARAWGLLVFQHWWKKWMA